MTTLFIYIFFSFFFVYSYGRAILNPEGFFQHFVLVVSCLLFGSVILPVSLGTELGIISKEREKKEEETHF